MLRPEFAAHIIHERVGRERRHHGIEVEAVHGGDVVGNDRVAWRRGAVRELEAVVDAQRLPRTGPAGGLFTTEIFQHERGEFTMFVPVGSTPRSVGRTGELGIPPRRSLPPSFAVHTTTSIPSTPRSART